MEETVTKVVTLALEHPVLALFILSMNSVAMMFGGIWVGSKVKGLVSKDELDARIDKENEAHAKIHDDMAHSYQRTMEETAEKVKAIFEEHTSKVASLLRGTVNDAEETRKTLKSITKDTFQLKGAMAVLLPKGQAAQIFGTEEDV